MKYLIFVGGVFVGLTLSRIPHYATYPFRVDKGPDNPVGWEPRYRNWKEGVEQ